MGNEWYFPSKPRRMNRQMVTCCFIQNHKLGYVTLPKVDAAVSSLSNQSGFFFFFSLCGIFAFFFCTPLRLNCKRKQIFVQLEY